MSVHLSFYLYRTGLGRFDFRGEPHVYYDQHFSPFERHLLEVHEHNHWSLANATLFGTIQMALAYAVLITKNAKQRARYDACLAETAATSREVYEGCAIYHEETTQRQSQMSVHPRWFNLFDDEIYRRSRKHFVDWLDVLPYSQQLKLSLAHNAAEVCLNCQSEILDRPSRIDPERFRTALSELSPNALMTQLSRCLRDNFQLFMDLFERSAVEPSAREFKLSSGAFRQEDALPAHNKRFTGVLSQRTYIAILEFAKKCRVPILDLPPEGIDLVRYDVWLNWVRRLPGHDRVYPNLVKDMAPRPLRVEPDLESETYDFHTFQTCFDPPSSDLEDDLVLEDWSPLHRAYHVDTQAPRGIYLSLDDGRQYNPLSAILETYPRTALVGGGYQDGSTTISMMTMEESFRRFQEVVAMPRISNINLRASRAVLAPRNEYTWQLGGARYRLVCRPEDLTSHLAQLRDLRPAAAVHWRNVDLKRGTALDTPIKNFPSTVGVLLEENSFYGWKRALQKLIDAGFQTDVHALLVGPQKLKVIVARTKGKHLEFFLYSLSTEALFEKLQSFVQGTAEQDLQIVWVNELSEIMSDRALLDMNLICEHLVRRGF